MSTNAEKTAGVKLGERLMQFRGDKVITFQEEDGTGKPVDTPLTLGDAIIISLFNGMDAQSREAASVQARRFRIASRVEDADIIAFTSEETTLIMDSAARYWGPLVIGRMYEHLDPAVLQQA